MEHFFIKKFGKTKKKLNKLAGNDSFSSISEEINVKKVYL